VAYGYREAEVNVPPLIGNVFKNNGTIIDIDPTLKITRLVENHLRPVVAVSLGPTIKNALTPHPCQGDTHTAAAGALYRFGRKIKTTGKYRVKFRQFVAKWLENNMTPLAFDTDVSFDTWLEKTPYTLARKQELRIKFADSNLHLGDVIPNKFLKVKSFVKDEHYPEYKHARAINSRDDVFKCLVGPIYQAISEVLFSKSWFIKKIPIADRPQYIIDLLHRVGAWYLISDYTSFEAHFTKALMKDCEMQLAKYMSKDLPEGFEWCKLIERAKTGKNRINFKNFSMQVEAKRMSGEMDTSLSNGFSNLMFMLFLMAESGASDVSGVIEGDDGLFVATGPTPDTQMFTDFGLSIKLGKVEDLNYASFCGMVFDLKDKTNVTDPIEVLVEFGWTTQRYARSRKGVHMCLLRSKALSLAYQYPSCPILSKLAYKYCQLTASYDSSSFLESQGTAMTNLYEIELLRKAHYYFDKNKLLEAPGSGTRLLVEKLYNVSVSDQLLIEAYIDDIVDLSPIDCPILEKYIPMVWRDYYDRFVIKLNYKSDLDGSGLIWPFIRKRADFRSFIK